MKKTIFATILFVFGMLNVKAISNEKYYKTTYENNVYRVEEINDEKNHLKTIKTKGINSNKKLDQKRLERINTLQNQQEEINSKGIKTGVACAISGDRKSVV